MPLNLDEWDMAQELLQGNIDNQMCNWWFVSNMKRIEEQNKPQRDWNQSYVQWWY